MSAYLRKLLKGDGDETKTSKVKTLPHWLYGIQSQRPVTYDTSELYEDRCDDDKKKQTDQQYTKKCYECGDFGHIAKECPNKWKKKLGGRFKESDWCCPMCGNINWDWRQHCNKCSTPKPSGCNAEKRTGKGGGYNEIDEETRKRLQSKRNENRSKRVKRDKENETEYNDYPEIYISNLPSMIKRDNGNMERMEQDELIDAIAQLFGQIGRIKKDYRRRGKGGKYAYDIRLSNDNNNARLVYEDAHTAPFAIQWFNGTEFEGETIVVKMKKDMMDGEYHQYGEYEEDYVNEIADIEDDHDKDEENEMADIEAELFGYARRGRGKGRGGNRGNRSRRNRKGDNERMTKSKKSRSRSRSRDRDRDRERNKNKNKNRNRDRPRYRASKTSRSYR